MEELDSLGLNLFSLTMKHPTVMLEINPTKWRCAYQQPTEPLEQFSFNYVFVNLKYAHLVFVLSLSN